MSKKVKNSAVETVCSRETHSTKEKAFKEKSKQEKKKQREGEQSSVRDRRSSTYLQEVHPPSLELSCPWALSSLSRKKEMEI